MKKQRTLGEETWMVESRTVEAGVTATGGHLWPARFRVGDRWVEPLSAAPWTQEPAARRLPAILRVLRGDFFCLPFGGNAESWRGETHPLHGETANRRWKREPAADAHTLHFSLRTRTRPGRVDKYISVAPGQTAIYQRHVVRGFPGPAPLGYHAMLRAEKPESLRISVGPFVRGQVPPGELESAAAGGYSCLRPGAVFSSLKKVPRADGGRADLSVYPAREGYEDLVMLMSDPRPRLGWTAAVDREAGWVWFNLKNPRVLRSTIFWISNGGRHMAPWNGRHRGVIGLEEVTSYFHFGLAPSVRSNPLRRAGVATCVDFTPDRALEFNTIMAMAAAPRDFDEVADIRALAGKQGVELRSVSGRRVRVPLNLEFLADPK